MHLDVRAAAALLGYPAAALGILIENAGIPFPGALMLLAVAAYAGAGNLDIGVVVLAGGLGALVGGDLGYLAGHRGGRPFVERFSHLLHVNPGHLARSEMLFTRYSGTTILVGRFVTGLRTWASVLAGMAGMPFWVFQLYSLAGAVVWAAAVGAAGFFLGRNWQVVENLARALGAGGMAAAAMLILAVLLLRTRASRIWP
jgi:membrane protein DedA with SNARE-associated domain